MIYFLVVVLTVVDLSNCRDSKLSGPYDTTLLSVGTCKDAGTNELRYSTRMSKVTRNKLCYTGWISLPFGLTDDMSEDWNIAIRGSTGGWKENFLFFKNKHSCSDTKRLAPRWFNILKSASFNDTSCPIPKGNYSFECSNMSNIQFKRIRMMTYGRYKLTVKYYLNKVLIGCTTFEAELTPREDITISSTSTNQTETEINPELSSMGER